VCQFIKKGFRQASRPCWRTSGGLTRWNRSSVGIVTVLSEARCVEEPLVTSRAGMAPELEQLLCSKAHNTASVVG
jgi:hypothetical protein